MALRFCMVTTFYPPYHFGGDGIFVYRLSELLASRGHKVDVIHSADAYHLSHPADPEGVVTLIVRDSGRWRAPRGTHRGRGLKMIEAATDELEVNSSDAGTEVVMRRRLAGP